MKNRIKELRESENLTQIDLGKMLEISRQSVISLENFKYNASLPIAYKVAKVFNKTIEEIFIFDKE